MERAQTKSNIGNVEPQNRHRVLAETKRKGKEITKYEEYATVIIYSGNLYK